MLVYYLLAVTLDTSNKNHDDNCSSPVEFWSENRRNGRERSNGVTSTEAKKYEIETLSTK